MTAKSYTINKGIGRSVTFKGLKAQYIWYLAGVLLGDLVFFAVLYISGVSSWCCVLVALGLGAAGVTCVYRVSHRYGEFGLMKSRAARHIPKSIRSFSRKVFIRLSKEV